MVKILWIDVETTGLDKHRHGIIQIAGLVDLDGQIVETFNLLMNPEAEIDPAAQEIHGIKPAEIRQYPAKAETLEQFKTILLRYVDPDDERTRFHPGGYNVRFDIGFLDAWFRGMKEAAMTLYFHRERVDPSMMMKAYQEYLGRDRMPSWSLRAVAAKMGVSLGGQHDALEDIRLTRDIHRRLLGFFSEGAISD